MNTEITATNTVSISNFSADYGSPSACEWVNSEVRILVVDDERLMRDLMALSLRRLGYTVEVVADGRAALAMLETEYFDLVMLDVVMQDMDGFTLLARLRSFSDVPVIMLTALNRQEDVVRGFELGADNYIAKPFNFKEVEARIQAVLRRAIHLLRGAAFDVATYGDLYIYNTEQRADVAGQPVDLTPTEFALLAFLAKRGERPTSKEELLQAVWGYCGHNNLNLVELAVRRLRTKIEADPSQPQRIVTVRGVGYKYVMQPDMSNA
jgi:DNA-binding response OmpR family regulator